MKHILSIQSHVASGYVGNRAAVFALQRLGCEVSFINTVQFSNHTGHGKWTGQIFSAEHIQDVINGLWDLHGFADLNAVLSGYLGTAEVGQVILNTVADIKARRPKVIYCCDPVLGDHDRGVYVLPETAEFIKHSAVQIADILTPNQFELGFLTGKTLTTLDDVLDACQTLHQRGPKIILVTSLQNDGVTAGNIGMLLSSTDGVWLTQTPCFEFKPAPTGSGDLIAALFLAGYLNHDGDAVAALRHATAAIYSVFKLTHAQSKHDLQIIAAQDNLVSPSEFFTVEKIR